MVHKRSCFTMHYQLTNKSWYEERAFSINIAEFKLISTLQHNHIKVASSERQDSEVSTSRNIFKNEVGKLWITENDRLWCHTNQSYSPGSDEWSTLKQYFTEHTDIGSVLYCWQVNSFFTCCHRRVSEKTTSVYSKLQEENTWKERRTLHDSIGYERERV